MVDKPEPPALEEPVEDEIPEGEDLGSDRVPRTSSGPNTLDETGNEMEDPDV